MQHESLQQTCLLNVREAAEYLAVSTALLYRLVANRQIQHVRVGVGRGTIRFRTNDLEQFKHSRKS
jgi:excisionase family DNA binding protein